MSRSVTNGARLDGVKSATITGVTDNFTVAFWFRAAATGTKLGVYNGDDGANGYGLVLDQTAGQLQVLYGGVAFLGGGAYATGAWQHAALVRSAGTGQVYLNGATLGTTFANTPNTPSGNFFYCGVWDSAGGTGTGYLAEAAMWTRALSGSELSSLSSGYSPLFYRTSLVRYHKIRGANNPEDDDTPGNNPGTVTNATAQINTHPGVVYPGGGTPYTRVRPKPFAPGLAR